MSEPVSLKLSTGARDPAWGRLGNGPTAATGEDALLRLTLWLADVAAEAALAATAPEARSTTMRAASRLRGEAEEPPIAEAAP